METFTKLFGSLLAFVYHCFDRIVIQGYLPLLTRPEHIVHFFRDVHGIYPITKQVLSKRTDEYQRWVEAFARNHRIPIQWPAGEMKKKGIKKEDYVRPWVLSMERRKRFGVYFIFKSMEQGPTFRSVPPKFPTDDPDCRILKRIWSRYTHHYFYIRDEVLGPIVMCVGSFLPFQTTYSINGHHFIAGELQRQGVRFRKDDNAFLWTDDPQALQAAADRLSPEIIRKRLDSWTLVLGPKFSKKDRAAVPLRRDYSLNQVEYCRNFIFRRNFPIHKIFERSCELGLLRLTADKDGSFKRSAVSVQLLDERCQHALQLDSALGQLLMVLRLEQLQISGQQQVILQFACRAHGDRTEAGEFGIPVASASLRQIRRDGRTRPPDLTRQPIQFLAGKMRP